LCVRGEVGGDVEGLDGVVGLHLVSPLAIPILSTIPSLVLDATNHHQEEPQCATATTAGTKPAGSSPTAKPSRPHQEGEAHEHCTRSPARPPRRPGQPLPPPSHPRHRHPL